MSEKIHTVDAHSDFYREVIVAGHQDARSDPSGTGPFFVRGAGRPDYDDDLGVVMMRSGSIVGLAYCADCQTYNDTGSNSVARVFINDVEVLNVGVSVTSDDRFTAEVTQAAGIDTFAAGDILTFKYTPGGGAGVDSNSVRPLILCELEFDKGKVLKLGETGYDHHARFVDDEMQNGF